MFGVGSGGPPRKSVFVENFPKNRLKKKKKALEFLVSDVEFASPSGATHWWKKRRENCVIQKGKKKTRDL